MPAKRKEEKGDTEEKKHDPIERGLGEYIDVDLVASIRSREAAFTVSGLSKDSKCREEQLSMIAHGMLLRVNDE